MKSRQGVGAPKSGLLLMGVAGLLGVVILFGLVGVIVRARGTADDGSLDVFAAASLTDVFTDLAAAYEALAPGNEIRLNFAGSSALREQLIDGAEADVYASANESNMAELVAAGRVAGEPRLFATNRLVLAVPAGNPGGVTGLADLARGDLYVGLCAVGVPCGDLATAALDQAVIIASVDTYEPNVRALVSRLVDGELDVALVYASDIVAAGDAVEAVPTAALDQVTSYPIAAIDGGDDGVASEADAFIRFVLSPDGRAILSRWGFGSP